MVTKNEIISKLIESLTDQRDRLVREIIEINVNETNAFEKRTMIEFQLSNLDMQIDNHLNKTTYDN